MQTMKRTGERSGWIMMALAGLGLWLATTGAALAADQWFDSGTAAGIQPASATTTGGVLWANAPAGSAMWASTNAGTTTPGLWTNGNNAYFTAAGTATVGVNGATASSVIFDSAGTWIFTNAGAPFTFTDLTLKRGTVTVYSNALGGSSSTPVTLGAADQLALGTLKLDTVAAGDNTFTIGNLTAAGATAITLNNSVAGSTPILSGQTLARTGRGTLIISPTNNATLGVTSKVLFTGGTNLFNGILAPWIIAQPSVNVAGDFLTYDPVIGLTTNGVYQTGAWDSTKVVAGSGTLNINTNAYALKITGATTINGGVTLNLGDNGYAGLLMNGSGSSLLGGGTLNVGTNELIIGGLANGTLATIGVLITGSGGLTVNGPLGFSASKLIISNMTYSGDTTINTVGLTIAPPAGTTTTYTNSVRGVGALGVSGPGTLILKDGNSSIVGALATGGGGTLILNGGSWTSSVGGLSVGAGTLTVSNGASLFFGGAVSLSSLATFNIGGSGARSSVTNLAGGFSGIGGGNASNTTTTITNAVLKSGGSVLYFGNNNTINVLSNGLWDVSGQTFTLGSAGSTGNVMTVNGGIVTNVAALSIGSTAASSSNSVLITNGGIYSVGLTLNGANSTATVRDGGVWSLGNGALTFNASVPAPQSAVQTSGSGVFTNVGGITLSGSNQAFTASVASNFYLGTAGNITLGSAGNGGNTLTLTGQTFATTASSTIGNGAGSNSNTLNVLAGTVWKGGGQTLVIGLAGATGNVVRVDGGGVSGGAIVTNFSATSLLNGFGNVIV